MTNGALSVEPYRPHRSRLRVSLTYLWRHGRPPDLREPRLFTELVQARKLADRDPRLPLMADKVAVKRVVADRLGAEWVIPTLWHGPVLPRVPAWPLPLAVKARHGCRQHVFVRGAGHDWAATRRITERWMRRPYGLWLDEWLYREIPRGLLVEPFIGEDGALPVDYKFYVFAGRVEAVQVHLEREERHRWMLFDRDWRRLSSPGDAVAAPASLAAMIAGAEELARDFDFARVDFYEVRGRPLFGEITFYPGSGLDRFDPVELDTHLGALWLAARDTQIVTRTTELTMKAAVSGDIFAKAAR